MSQINQLTQQLQQAQEQIKQLSGDLQTAQRESVQDRKRVEVEKFKGQIGNVSNKAEMAGQLANYRMQDNLKNTQQSQANEQTNAVNTFKTQATDAINKLQLEQQKARMSKNKKGK